MAEYPAHLAREHHWPLPQIGSMDLQAKVACLSRPEIYPERPAAVEVVQTHMSFVFLTGSHAYKLKKPVRYHFLDFSTLEARYRDCQEEVRLNRRLARDVYLGVVPLTFAPQGGLRLGGDGEPVEWLVQMRQLPKRLMLDSAIRGGVVSEEDIRRFTLVLADFYRRSEPVPIGAEEYRQRFQRDIRDNHRELSHPDYTMPRAALETVIGAEFAFLEKDAGLFDERVRQRRIIEGHGDLRPEHVCLAPEPVFIDCLQFNREMRILDPADELGYLALECEFAGAPGVGDVVLDTYRQAAGDHPPGALIHFYQACRATLRAKVSVWHLKDHLHPAEQVKWTERGRDYLRLAQRHCEAL